MANGIAIEEETALRNFLEMPIPLEQLRTSLLDLSCPIAKRTHAAFILRTMGSIDAVSILSEALRNKNDSSLMRHELAYILGQIQNPVVVPQLIDILSDESDDILVRHESAEALGAIGAEIALDSLAKFSTHDSAEIAETCLIAIDLINWRKNGESISRSEYLSVDPAPPVASSCTIEDLQKSLMDSALSLFQRYRAMFSLRNMNSDESALALLIGFEDSSALFRHEIAYVLGQMQRKAVTDGLVSVLQNKSEHRMVRHEAAEALGAIGGEEIEEILKQYSFNDEQVVVESCHVALDTMDYWNSNNFLNDESILKV